MSAFARLASFIILKLNLTAGACFQADQQGSYFVLRNAEHHGLLMTLLILVSDCEEVLARFAEEKYRRYEYGHGVSPVGLHSILEQIDLVVSHAQILRFGDKREIVLVSCPDFAVGSHIQGGYCATYVLRA